MEDSRGIFLGVIFEGTRGVSPNESSLCLVNAWCGMQLIPITLSGYFNHLDVS